MTLLKPFIQTIPHLRFECKPLISTHRLAY